MKYLIPILTLALLTNGRAKSTERETPSSLEATKSAARVDNTDWRSALLAQFPYKPTGTVVATDPVVSILHAPVDPDVVILEPFVVREKGMKFREVERIFRGQEESARSEALDRRLGIEKHVFTFGRNQRFAYGYVSIFYVPVAAGFSW